jgi:hypothetical protein
MEIHDGNGITASNHPDGGAEFRFWLPAQTTVQLIQESWDSARRLSRRLGGMVSQRAARSRGAGGKKGLYFSYP